MEDGFESCLTCAIHSGVGTTLYNGNLRYENNDLKEFSHEEGRVRRKPDGSFVYGYFVKDHRGNT